MHVAFDNFERRYRYFVRLGWSGAVFEDMMPFVKLGIYGVVMVCLEWGAIEICTIISGIFDVQFF